MSARSASAVSPTARIYIGDPAGNNFQEFKITDPSQVFGFSHNDFDGPGVWLIPPAESDVDFSFAAVYDAVNTISGNTRPSDPETVQVVVDAVADKPDTLEINGLTQSNGEAEFTLNATFYDYVDGSESHYFLVEQLTGWTGSYDTVSYDNKTWFKIPLDNAIDPGTGIGTTSVTLTMGVAGQPVVLAVAEESPTDKELDTTNNIAYSDPATVSI